MRTHVRLLWALGLAAALTACSKNDAPAPAPATTTAPAAAASGIAWVHATSEREVDKAFELARVEYKPLLLYWGANWCPPCNQLKATLFNRQDVIERSRAFVPVYIDGDSPGAQKLGARFKVSGYPTLVLFNPRGTELTRLPGEVDPEQYTRLLTTGMNAQRPVKAVLADALADAGTAKPLPTNDWRLLAFYAWDLDENQVVPEAELPALLRKLSARCPPEPREVADRLLLKAAAAAGEQPAPAPLPDAAWRERVRAVLADERAARAQMDVLTNSADDIARATSAPRSPDRAALVGLFDTTLVRLAGDSTLSRADRLTAQLARVQLARLDAPKGAALPPALVDDARAMSAQFDREVMDRYERQAVIPTAAYLLEQAGLAADAEKLLQNNLAKSHSPYYLMSALSGNAKRRGDKTEALRWSEQAFEKSEGPATRLQWGASYVAALVELSPQDESRIETAARQVFSEAAAQPDAFYERGAHSLQKVGKQLQTWNQGQSHAVVIRRLQAQLDAVCDKLPADDPQRAVCQGLLKPAPRKSGA